MLLPLARTLHMPLPLPLRHLVESVTNRRPARAGRYRTLQSLEPVKCDLSAPFMIDTVKRHRGSMIADL